MARGAWRAWRAWRGSFRDSKNQIECLDKVRSLTIRRKVDITAPRTNIRCSLADGGLESDKKEAMIMEEKKRL
jgi:hypothetical protein